MKQLKKRRQWRQNGRGEGKRDERELNFLLSSHSHMCLVSHFSTKFYSLLKAVSYGDDSVIILGQFLATHLKVDYGIVSDE